VRPPRSAPKADGDLPSDFFDSCGNCNIYVRVYCRPIKDALGSGFGAKHCYLVAKYSNGRRRHSISAFPGGSGILEYFPMEDLREGGSPAGFQLPTGMSPCDFYRCAKNAALDINNERHEYEKPPFDMGELHNSNWFITEIVRRCGASVSTPRGASGGGRVGLF
jgi:hypothetical protein